MSWNCKYFNFITPSLRHPPGLKALRVSISQPPAASSPHPLFCCQNFLFNTKQWTRPRSRCSPCVLPRLDLGSATIMAGQTKRGHQPTSPCWTNMKLLGLWVRKCCKLLEGSKSRRQSHEKQANLKKNFFPPLFLKKIKNTHLFFGNLSFCNIAFRRFVCGVTFFVWKLFSGLKRRILLLQNSGKFAMFRLINKHTKLISYIQVMYICLYNCCLFESCWFLCSFLK